MNNFNKLIEQYPGDKIRLQVAFWETKKDPYYWSVHLQEFLKFIKWLASRPTCGVEQRKFLDALEKYGTAQEGDEYHWSKILLSNGQIQENFETEIMQNSEGVDNLDLQKVIKGE